LNLPEKTSKNHERGFTLIELISTLVIISVLAAIVVPRYINAEASSKLKGLELGVSEMNGRETLTWAMIKLSNSGYIDDVQVWTHLQATAGTDLGPDYDWPNLPRRDGGTLRFKKDVWSDLIRAFSSSEAPGKWRR
jgi:prepilin-type N-terminal cleavage/methylation domain-containing protein